MSILSRLTGQEQAAPTDEFVVWRRRRKNRKGRENLVVRVIGRTPAGYIVIERWRNGVRLIDTVHPRNLEAAKS